MSSSRWEDSEQGDAGTGESASSRGSCISAVAPGGTDAGMAALRGVPRWLLPAAGARALQHERPAELPVSTRRHQATRADTEPLSTPCASRRGSARSAGHWLAEQHAQGREDNLCQPFFSFTTHLPPTPFHLHSATLHPHSTPDRASPTRRWQGAGPATYLAQASAGSPHLCQPSRVGAQPHHVKPDSADL